MSVGDAKSEEPRDLYSASIERGEDKYEVKLRQGTAAEEAPKVAPEAAAPSEEEVPKVSEAPAEEPGVEEVAVQVTQEGDDGRFEVHVSPATAADAEAAAPEDADEAAVRFEQQDDGSATVTFERTAEAAPAVAVVAEVKEGDDGAFRLQVSLQVTEAPPAVAADVVDVAVNEGEEGFSVDVTLDDAASRIQAATRESLAAPTRMRRGAHARCAT